MAAKRVQCLRGWLVVLAYLLDDVVVLVTLILLLRYLNVEITLPLIIVIAAIVAGYALLIHKAVIPALRRRKVAGAEGMVGQAGRVVEPLNPAGVVRVGGELWKARTDGEIIAAGETVEITAISDLTLVVRRKTG